MRNSQDGFYLYQFQFHPFGDFNYQQTLATLRHVQREKRLAPWHFFAGIEDDSPLQGMQ